MAYDEQLAQRVRASLAAKEVSVEEKQMMGGLCFMVNGKMCIGVEKERLMARIDPNVYEAALGRKGCTPMDFTGRPMRGFVFVSPEGFKSRQDLESWIALALEFNPRALASKRRQSVKDKAGVEVSKQSRSKGDGAKHARAQSGTRRIQFDFDAHRSRRRIQRFRASNTP